MIIKLGAPLALAALVWIGFFGGGDKSLQPTTGARKAEISNCRGTAITPTDDIVSVINAGKVGEVFCIKAGTYRIGQTTIVPKDQMRLVGEKPVIASTGSVVAKTVIVGESKDGIIYFANPASGVVIENLDISGATGVKSDSDPATKQTGRGINGNGGNAVSLTVRNSRIHHNANAGIGGAGNGMKIQFTELDHNGSESYVGCCSGGVKSAGPFTITDSYVHDNVGMGIWQDVCGTDFVVTHNRVFSNSHNGIRYEHGSDCPGRATITRNVVRGNNTSALRPGGGIEINSAPNAEVAWNTLSGNSSAGIIVRGARGPVSGANIHDNVLGGDLLVGCDRAGVLCERNK